MTSSKRPYRRFENIIPGPFEGLQVNYCRDPTYSSYGVHPVTLSGEPMPTVGQAGLYNLVGSIGDTSILCRTCRRLSRPMSNEGVAMEIKRLRTANGILAIESCPRKSCKNHGKSLAEFPNEYYAHGKTPSGAVRKRCKRCRTASTLGDHRRRPTAGSVNRDIVRDIVNRASLNAMMRKLDLNPATLYERIDFIHQQMVAFEAFKVRALRTLNWKRKYYALATDAQDYRVNWQSRDRRAEIQLSAISTAENITGFILRSDVNFDPTSGDVVTTVAALLESEELDNPNNLAASDCLVIPSLPRAAAHVLKSGKNLSKLPLTKRQELMRGIEELLPKYISEKDPGSDCAINGTLIRKLYTATAHFSLNAEMLPRDAELHLMLDTDGAFVPSVVIGYVEALKERRADLT